MDPITSLAIATAAFVGSHLLLSHPLRAPLVARLGELGFQALYSVVALATLGWMILAYRAAPPAAPYWSLLPDWGWAASVLMLIASILLAGSLVGNPALPHPGAAPRDIPAPRGVFAITRHPMNWSFMIWAAVHAAIIGTPRNLLVAGGILVLALVGSLGQDRKKARLMGDVWRRWQAQTSYLPFAAMLAGRVPWRRAAPGLVALLGGTALWALVTWRHAPEWSLHALLS